MYDKYLINFLLVTNPVDPPSLPGLFVIPGFSFNRGTGFFFKFIFLNSLERNHDPATV